jgi:transposase-like protein
MKKCKGVDDAQRLRILEEHLSGASKCSPAKKYGLSVQSINLWLHTFGVPEAINPVPEAFEVLALEQEVKRLRIRLARAEMAEKAYSTMIDPAGEVYQIEVRKNFDTKQS